VCKRQGSLKEVVISEAGEAPARRQSSPLPPAGRPGAWLSRPASDGKQQQRVSRASRHTGEQARQGWRGFGLWCALSRRRLMPYKEMPTREALTDGGCTTAEQSRSRHPAAAELCHHCPAACACRLGVADLRAGKRVVSVRRRACRADVLRGARSSWTCGRARRRGRVCARSVWQGQCQRAGVCALGRGGRAGGAK
jgi:hypothetical protein